MVAVLVHNPAEHPHPHRHLSFVVLLTAAILRSVWWYRIGVWIVIVYNSQDMEAS